MPQRRVGLVTPASIPLVSSFIGLQALACGVVGVVVSAVLDHAGYTALSTGAGLFVAVTLILIVIGYRLRRHPVLWAALCGLSLVNLGGFYLSTQHPQIKPIAFAPFMLVEVALYLLIVSRLRAKHEK